MNVTKKYLFSCIVLALLLCYAQIADNSLIRMGCLGGYLLMLGWACSRNCTLPILLFFLPWSPLMRTSPDTYSAYTFGLVLSCAISVVRNRLMLKKYAIISGLAIAFFTLASKLLDGSSLAFSYIAFLMMLVIMPSVKQESEMKTYDFYQLTNFYSAGVIIAALCALWFAAYPNIARFIRVDSYNVVLRRCGFYGDANFYTAQITAALGGWLFLLLREERRSRIFMLIMIFVLVYCGAMSGSKSFVLITAGLVVVWLWHLMKLRNQPWLKVLLLLAVCAFAVIIATSDLFRDLIEVLIVRFSRSTGDMNSFTTNRVELWESYLEELFSDVKVFFLGRGFTNIKVNDKGSHNTILQMFYQFGILGAPFLLYWNIYFLREGFFGQRRHLKSDHYALLVALGVYVPWLAIDALFFDDYFLLQWYFFMAMQYLPEVKGTTALRKRGNWGSLAYWLRPRMVGRRF